MQRFKTVYSCKYLSVNWETIIVGSKSKSPKYMTKYGLPMYWVKKKVISLQVNASSFFVVLFLSGGNHFKLKALQCFLRQMALHDMNAKVESQMLVSETASEDSKAVVN